METSITCLCTQISQRIHLSSTSQALQICHCSSCRAASGVLCTTYLALHSAPVTVGLNEYQQRHSGATGAAEVSRWFCAVCGAHVFARAGAGTWYVATGVLLERPVSGSAAGFEHWGVGQTRDGGLAGYLNADPDLDTAGDTGDVAGCLLGLHPDPDVSTTTTASNDNDTLPAHCLCQRVSFTVTRPNPASLAAWSPWPDLLVPFHSASAHEIRNPDDVKWWLTDSSNTSNAKYLAGTCACTSCRLGSGFPIQTWAFIPKTNIHLHSSSSGGGGSSSSAPGRSDGGLEYRDIKALQSYQSSPGVFREFCSGCGATVFWHCRDRPDLIDVSVGVLQARSGARAEDWLGWVTSRVSFAEDALDGALIAVLERGLRKSSV